jgi:SWI/SNF-related matrix-associated actin-dependent regulator 1 of chromatin subfamily A
MLEVSNMRKNGQSPTTSSTDYAPTPKAKMARPRPAVPSSPIVVPPSPAPVRPPPKAKKNEKSAIYANRTGGSGRRRDPDSESEAEEEPVIAGGVGSDDSEMDWSGDEGRKKKRRRGNDELDAEGAAVKAFNEDTVELLTGTIGELLVAIVVQH